MSSLIPLLLLACSDKEADDTAGPDDTATDSATDTDTDTAPDTGTDTLPEGAGYGFTGRDGTTSVVYDGQVFRHLLIVDMKTHLGELTARVDGGFFPVPGEVTDELDFYFSFDSDTSSTVEHLFVTDPAAVQTTYGEVSGGKDLVSKIAGNDPAGQHRDWSTEFVGWSEEGVTTPESLVRHWFDQIDAAAVARSNGDIPLGPDGAPVASVYLTAQGQDLQQLLQKFLAGSVTFSQGTDDYLDDDLEGQGLLASHAALEEGKPYTALEHAWDEGFGYYGASRDYCSGDDEVVASPGWSDTWLADGAIDLLTEVCWHHSTNAAKRDLGAVVPTDFSGQAFQGFVGGRALLASTGEDLNPGQLAELQGYRDQAVRAWEDAIAASVVHYLNAVLQDMGNFGTESYDFATHAKNWSELKGFALSFQFNPRSPLSDEAFALLHERLGLAPVLPTADPATIEAYRAGLLEARADLGTAYGFDPANLGADDGTGGW